MKASFEKLCEDSVVFFTLQTYCRLTETDSSRDGGGGGGAVWTREDGGNPAHSS